MIALRVSTLKSGCVLLLRSEFWWEVCAIKTAGECRVRIVTLWRVFDSEEQIYFDSLPEFLHPKKNCEFYRGEVSSYPPAFAVAYHWGSIAKRCDPNDIRA